MPLDLAIFRTNFVTLSSFLVLFAVMPHLLRHRLFFEVFLKVYTLLSDFVRIIIYIYIG